MSEDNLTTVDCTDVISTEEVQEPIIQITENGVEGFEIVCRLCANRSDHLIPIYSEEGITNDLADKMNLYLPIKISKTDLLPLQCCFQCASTVLTWHELVIASVEADRRLREVQTEVEKQIAEQATEPGPSQVDALDDERQIDSSSASLNPFRQDEIQPEFKSEPELVVKKRGRAKKHLQNIKFEAAPDITTDGEWIKTELVLESEDVNPFIANCELTEDQDNSAGNLNPFRQNDIQAKFKSEPLEVTTVKKRGRAKKHIQNIKFETAPDLSTHEEWIKTDLQLESEDVNPFIADCELTEDQDMKLSPAGVSASDNSDFDDLDPEYDPRNDSKPLKKHSKVCADDSKKNTQKKREYRCDYCHSAAVRKEDLRKHVQTEHPEHYESYTDKRKTRRRSKIDQEAVNRAKVVVDKRTYYHCNECGKNLHSPYTYIWHNRIHTGERPFVCDLCGKQFRVSQGLVRHLRETHAGIKNFPCDLCGRMFATRRNVEEHRRIHTNERPYICDLCGKAFKQKASLFVHNRSHTDSFPFKCSYCNQGFRTRPPLLVHVTRHTGEKPYACDICGRCFRIKYELKRHRLIHSDDKPFSCTDCGLSFRQKRYLRNHNKINHNRLTP